MSRERMTAPADESNIREHGTPQTDAGRGTGEQMRQILTPTLTTMLVGACSLPSTEAVARTGPRSAQREARPHNHQHARAHDEEGVSGAHHSFANADALTQVFDDPARDAWQRPDDVLRALELEPTMIVADVGAGTGYFSVWLARAVPRGEVIAIDIEPDMVRFLNERSRREGLSNLRTLQANAGAPGLAASSVDRILVVHVWHHLSERGEYARGLAAALRPGGRLLVVDFSPAARRGPPGRMRVAPEMVIAELEGAGLSASVSPIAPPDQYIVDARRLP
jgi:arsenite methyltransferase